MDYLISAVFMIKFTKGVKMNELEQAYFNKWKEQVNENRKLKQKLEKFQKREDLLKEMEWKYFKYKKFFEPLAREYKKAYKYLTILDDYFEQLVKLYNEFILLNPNFTVKLSDNDKNKIIKELQLILLSFIKLNKPLEYEIIREITIDSKTPRTTKKEFERKNFIVKKKK